MAIKVKLGDEDPPIKIKIKESPTEETIKLNVKRSLSGDIMIYDHDDIDIVVLPSKNKILTFAKQYYGDHVYEAQNRFFTFLRKRGVISYDSIQGGTIFSSMEAKIQESKEYNSVQHTLLAVSRFIDKERPLMEFEKHFEKHEEDRLNQPAPGEYTEWNPEEHHSDKKGSIQPGHFPYGLQSAAIYRLEE